jgi:two-component system, NarL family, nitrate/nitrite response regulator NarL
MSDPNRVRVFVASEVRVYRAGLARLVATEDGLELAGAGKAPECPSRFRGSAQPDVVLIDVTEHGALSVAREIHSAAGEAKLVVLVSPDQEIDLPEWAGAGVSGFLSREASSHELVEILRRAACGASPCSPDVADAYLRRARERSGNHARLEAALTKREAQIAELLADGLSNKAIASQLFIELTTVKNHVHNILEKLDVHSRGEAAAKLRQSGLVIAPRAF